MSGTVDVYHSRRTNYEECEYWIRDESNREPPERWALNNLPSGMFYAKETNAKENRMAQLDNAFAFDEEHITIQTDDDIDFIKRGCLVSYDGEIWLVETTQKRLHRKESEFGKEKHYKFYINMRR